MQKYVQRFHLSSLLAKGEGEDAHSRGVKPLYDSPYVRGEENMGVEGAKPFNLSQ
jgi:hypothetical protein